MEAIAPPLELLMEVRFGIEKGQSLKNTIRNYTLADETSPWRKKVILWLNLIEMGRPTWEVTKDLSFARRQVLELLEQGLRGESIFSQVCGLEEEIFESMKLEMEEFIVTLPIKTLIPLLFFQFPAFLALLLGPFLIQFLAQS